LAIIGLAALSVLPTLIVILRRGSGVFPFFALNVLCDLTVFGWIIAMVFAFKWPTDPTKARPKSHVTR
jgi:uncharacterized membrane protein YqaE (UPF0057 family)